MFYLDPEKGRLPNMILIKLFKCNAATTKQFIWSPHLHITLGDEAFFLDVTDLEELMRFLQDRVLTNMPTLPLRPLILTLEGLFVASVPSLRHPGPSSGVGEGRGDRQGCHRSR